MTINSENKKKIEVIKHKIRFVGRMARIWKVEKENKQLILSLKMMCPDGKIPAGTLIKGKEGLTDKLKQFMLIKDLDAPNEKWQGPKRHTIAQLHKESDYHEIIEEYQRQKTRVN